MFSYLLSQAICWRLPLFAVGKDCDGTLAIHSETIGCQWLPRSPLEALPPDQNQEQARAREICEIFATDDLYHILGVDRSPVIDRLTLRRAYLSRSKACHPDKCPGNPNATHAFQRVSIAYGVLSQPSLKRTYDARPADAQSDFLRSRPRGYADETLKGVLLGIVDDFLDGNLDTIRTLLHAISDLNPSLKLSDDGIDAVLAVLEDLRTRVLTCRACILALHAELVRVLELQCAFRRLPYLDVAGRSRLTVRLARITLYLPVTLENAIQDAREDVAAADGRRRTGDGTAEGKEGDKGALLPRRVVLLIRGIDTVLDKMERVLG